MVNWGLVCLVRKGDFWYTTWMDSYHKFIAEKAKQKREMLGGMFFPRTPVLMLNLKGIENSKEMFNECKGLLEGLNTIRLTTLVTCSKSTWDKLPKGDYVYYVSSQKRAEAVCDFAVDFDSRSKQLRSQGCVPIAQFRDEKETVDYNPIRENGDGFYFKEPTRWDLFDAIVRARETYNFPYDWENLIKEISRK